MGIYIIEMQWMDTFGLDVNCASVKFVVPSREKREEVSGCRYRETLSTQVMDVKC